jgi:hypothetical protein
MNIEVEQHLIKRLKEVKEFDAGSAQLYVSVGLDIAITIIEDEIKKKMEAKSAESQ